METKGVKILTGNTDKAVAAMFVPMVAVLLVQAATIFIDSAWVSALGSETVAAIS